MEKIKVKELVVKSDKMGYNIRILSLQEEVINVGL